MARRKRDKKGRFLPAGRARAGAGKARSRKASGRARAPAKKKKKGNGGGGGGPTLVQRALYIVAGGAGAAVLAATANRVRATGTAQQREWAERAPALMAAVGAGLAVVPQVPSPLKFAGAGLAAVGVALLVGQWQRERGQASISVDGGAAAPKLQSVPAQGVVKGWAERARQQTARLVSEPAQTVPPGRLGDAALATGEATMLGPWRRPRFPGGRLIHSTEPVVSPGIMDNAQALPLRRLARGNVYQRGQWGYAG